jgi:lipoprotein-anchoring transpeptidase ErfK/SrfK
MNTFAKIIAAAAFAATAIGFATPGQAGIFSIFQPKPKIVATVSISQQKMFLKVTDNRGATNTYVWDVSTGRAGYDTPMGEYHPTWLDANHKSAQYEDAPMPFAVFFVDGIAVHGTEAVSRLGHAASHGCVRLAPENAAAFFQLVEDYGKWNTKIIVTD